MEYYSRVVDAELLGRLGAAGAVVVEGPRACGKTATARRVAASEVLLDVNPDALLAATVDPGLVLDGATPRLIDEWQIEPAIWNHVRRAIDDRRAAGQFVLTGSAAPPDDITRHTGAGRISRLRMRPMSLFETKHASGDVSLAELMSGGRARSKESTLSVRDVVERIAVGGWPGMLGMGVDDALRAVGDYVTEIERVDIGRGDGVRREPQKVGRLLRSLARNVGTYAAATTLAADTGGLEPGVDDDTVRDYLSALDRVFVVEDQPAWAPHLRSRSMLRTKAKRQFVDPSLAVAALRATPERLLRDLSFTGFLFEGMVIRDLRVYAQSFDAQVLQYRDSTGLEIDAIVETREGKWGAFEVKLGSRFIDDAARSLLRFADRVDSDRTGRPGVLGVIVPTGYAFVRSDGVSVIPIGALGP